MQSKGKLDPGMHGPYRVTKILKNGHYGLQLLAEAYGKLTYAAAQIMVPWKGEWTPDECAAFFDSSDHADVKMTTLSAVDLDGDLAGTWYCCNEEALFLTDEAVITSGEAE